MSATSEERVQGHLSPPDPSLAQGRAGAEPPSREPAEAQISAPEPSRPRIHHRHGHGSRHGTAGVSSSSSPLRLSPATIVGSLRVASFALWALTALAALTLGVVADVFQAEGSQFPLALVLAASIGLNLIAVCLVLFLGKLTKKGFAVFQPFAGGQKFALMQAAGYTLAVFSALGMAVLHIAATNTGEEGASHPRYGAYAVLSGFLFVAQVLLITSLLVFHPPAATSPTAWRTSTQTLSFRNITESPAREYAFITVCAAVMVVSAALAELYPAYRPVSVPLVACFAAVAIATVAYLGKHFVPTYRVVMVTLQAGSLTALQLLGNTLMLFCFCGSVILHNAGLDSPPSWHLGVALVGVTGVCCHQLLLRLTQSREREAALAAAAFADAAVNPASPLIREYASVQEGRRLGSLNGATMSTGVGFLFSFAVYGISVLLSFHSRSGQPGGAATKDEDGGGEFVAQGLMQVQSLFVVLLFALPPFTHLQGRLVFGRSYEVWQPFKGSVEFVLLQAAAWASYAVAILFRTLQVSEAPGTFHSLLVLTTALLLSQMFVHVSLLLFDEGKHTAIFRDQGSATATSDEKTVFPNPLEAAKEPEAEHRALSEEENAPAPSTASSRSGFVSSRASATSLAAIVVNGELLLAIVLGIVSMLIRGVCDTVEHIHETGSRGASLKVPTKELAVVANLLSLLAPPIAQLSMRDRVPFLHVTSTSVGFNVLQTIAWLTYLTLFFILLVNTVTGERHLLLCAESRYFMEYSAQGFLLGAPLVCVLISNVCEAQEQVEGEARTARVRRAADALLQLLLLRGSAQTANAEQHRRAVELIRSVAGPRLTSTDWGVATLAAADDADGDEGGGGATATTTTAAAAAAAAGAAAAMPRSAFDPLDEAEEEQMQADRAASVTAARYITVIMCLACTAAFASAAFLADTQPVITLLYGVAGALVLTLCCVSLQYVLGHRLHGNTSRYTLFMPFVGGWPFVLWQALGWTCYTFVACLIIACVVEGRGSRLVFFVMNVLSVVAEGAVFHSIPLFDAEALPIDNGFLGKNTEGLLAVVILLGTFSFTHVYDLAREGSVSANVSALVPVVITSLAMCLTIPMGLLSLQRQAEHYGVSPFAFFDTIHESDDDDNDSEGDVSEASPRSGLSSKRGSWVGNWSDAGTSRGAGAAAPREAGMQREVSDSSQPWSGPMSPVMREELIHHAQAEGRASPLTGVRTALDRRRSSFADSFSLASPHYSPTSDADSAMARQISTFARSINLNSRRGRANSYIIAVSFAVSLLLAFFLVLLLPFAAVLLAYSCIHGAPVTYAAGARALEILVACFGLVVVVPMVVAPVARRSKAVRWVHSAMCAWSIYSIPTITVFSGLTPPLLIHSRGAWLFAINMCSMACLSTIPYVHLIAFIFSVCSCGYFAQFHLYGCLYLHRQPFVLWKCVFDLTCALFWLWYGRRYVGRPEVTGRYQSNAASRFFQRYFFEGMSHWFSLRVVLADLYLLPSEQGIVTLVDRKKRTANAHPAAARAAAAAAGGDDDGGLRSQTHRRVVNRSDPANQYLLSFHPHGVFPGTAMYAPKTAQFERVVGANATNFISTHCADVVFSVPLMREFPLCLGSLSVSRAGIEHSIKDGNSPLIVTGGQSEMLLVRMSSTEMHLVCHHLGFVKVALRHRIPLVPVLSFSECNIMDNVHCLGVQRWFLKRIGFPFPTLPHGFMKLPLPSNTPMTLVVGPPLMPLPGRDNWEDVACQEEMRIRYFCHLEYLFYRYREVAGYPDMKLYLHYGIDDEAVLATPPAPGTRVATDYVLDEDNAAIHRAIAANRANRAAREARKAAKQTPETKEGEQQGKKSQ